MTAKQSRATFVRSEDQPIEFWTSGEAPGVSWRTLISGDRKSTSELCAGTCNIEPGGALARHHHEEAEVYYFLSGSGKVFVEDEVFVVVASDTIFIPGGAWHRIVNESDQILSLFYCFATDSFSDVMYTYGDGSTWQAEPTE